jgi:hypothetical protein
MDKVKYKKMTWYTGGWLILLKLTGSDYAILKGAVVGNLNAIGSGLLLSLKKELTHSVIPVII